MSSMKNKKETKSNIVSRINRASGQVSAVSKMIEDGRPCKDVVTQFQASRKALERAYAGYLQENLSTCMKNKDEKTMKFVINSITSK